MIVYKYRDWEDPFHKKILTKFELYLASPKQFNDPFDCKIVENFELLSSVEIDEYLFSIADRSFQNHPNKVHLIGETIMNFKKRNPDRQSIQKAFNEIVFADADRFFGIISLSKTWSNIPMWSYYANSHKGFCIGFHEEKIRDARIFGKAGDVTYKDNFPEIKPTANKNMQEALENSFNKQFVKSKAWEGEEEYRLLKNFFPTAPTSSNERVFKINHDTIAEVILGINSTKETKREIFEICKKQNLVLYQAKKSDFKFKIEKERIL